ARVNLHNRAADGLALLAWEADRILSYRLVPLKAGGNPLLWGGGGPPFPNFTPSPPRLGGARPRQGPFERPLPPRPRRAPPPLPPVVGPGAEVVLDVTTADQLGRPVAAELSLALVDRALLRLHGDNLPPIGPYFHDRKRTGAFTTSATNAFRYAPIALPVSGT